jgi:hypothetical protein
MTRHTVLVLFCILLVPCLAQAQPPMALPSGSVIDLLRKAETGDRPALYAVALGARQVFPDGTIEHHIDAQKIDVNVLALIDDASAAYAVAVYHSNGFLQADESDAEKSRSAAQFCVWVARAVALNKQTPSPEPATKAQWGLVESVLAETVAGLTAPQRLACQAHSENWTLK